MVLLVVLGGFGWFWLVPCFSNYEHVLLNICSVCLIFSKLKFI